MLYFSRIGYAGFMISPKNAARYFLFDIGNSALKAVAYDAIRREFVDQVLRLAWDDSQLEERLRGYVDGDHPPCGGVVSSVNARHQSRLQTALGDRIRGWDVVDYRCIDLATRVQSVDRVGIDRLLAAWMVWRSHWRGEPLLVLQVGTAITFDLIDSEGTYCGGAIMPSETTLLRSLAHSTDRLPLLQANEADDSSSWQPGDEYDIFATSPPPKPQLPGQNTEAAIRAGVWAAVVGGVERSYAAYCEMLGCRPTVWVSGGGCRLLTACLDLPLRGIREPVLAALATLAAADVASE